VLKAAEIETIEVALLEASRRVADAERAEELVVDGERASRAVEIGAGLMVAAQRAAAIATWFKPTRPSLCMTYPRARWRQSSRPPG
jgi:hypothetical protein